MNRLMCRMSGSIALALALIAAHPVFSNPTDETDIKRYKIGVYSPRSDEFAVRYWAATIKYLNDSVQGASFGMVPISSKDIIKAAREDKLDFIITNPAIYVTLESDCGMQRIATLKGNGEENYNTFYGGTIFVNAFRTDIKNISDINKKRFMAVGKLSLGGWISARYEMKKCGIDPFKDFKSITFADNESEDAVVEAVRTGRADAGVINSSVFEKMIKENNIDQDEFRIIRSDSANIDKKHYPYVSTRLYPQWAFAKARKTDRMIAERVSIALMQIEPDDLPAVSGRYSGWTVPENYQSVHDCLRYLNIGPYKDYGKIRFKDVLRAYYPWIVTIIILFIFMALSTVLAILSSRKAVISKTKFRELFDNMSSGAAVFEAVQGGDDFIFKDLNKAAERIDSVKREEIIGKSALKIFPGIKEFGLLNILKEVWMTGISSYHPASFYKDNRIRGWRENYVYKLRTGEVAAVYNDITAQKEAQIELNRNYEMQSITNSILNLSLKDLFMEDLLKQALDLLLSIKWIALQPRGAIFLREGELETLTMKADIGLSEAVKKRCAKMPFGECVCGKCAATKTAQFADNISQKCSSEDTDANRHTHYSVPIVSDGKTIGAILLYMNKNHLYDPREERFICLLSDVLASVIRRKETEDEIKKAYSELRKVQGELIQSSKMAAVGQLASGIAHELNQPLGVIKGFAQLIELDMEEGSPIKERFEKIVKSANRMDGIIKAFRAFARKSEFSLVPLKIESVIDDTLEVLGKELSDFNITVSKKIAENIPEINGDLNQLEQVLINLMLNGKDAIRQVRESGTVEISVELAGNGKAIKISISDNGCGISDMNKNDIFSPFFTTKPPGKGTGLGLAIVYRIIEMHGGTILFESEKGKGTTFAIMLPVGGKQKC